MGEMSHLTNCFRSSRSGSVVVNPVRLTATTGSGKNYQYGGTIPRGSGDASSPTRLLGTVDRGVKLFPTGAKQDRAGSSVLWVVPVQTTHNPCPNRAIHKIDDGVACSSVCQRLQPLQAPKGWRFTSWRSLPRSGLRQRQTPAALGSRSR